MDKSKALHLNYRGVKIEKVREKVIADYGPSIKLVELDMNTFYNYNIRFDNTIRVLVAEGIVLNTMDR